MLLKYPAETLRRIESCLQTNFLHGKSGRLQKFTCLLNPIPVQIIGEASIRILCKKLGEIAAADAAVFAHSQKRQIAVVIVIPDIVLRLLQVKNYIRK